MRNDNFVKIEELQTVDRTKRERIKDCFDYTFFKEITDVIKEENKKFNALGKITELKNDIVFSGDGFFKAGKIQNALAKSTYGDVFIAHTTKLAEIRKNCIGLSITKAKDIKEIVRKPRKYLKERASVNHKLEGQLCFDEIFDIKSTISADVTKKYDMTGIIIYDTDTQNRLISLKIVFFDAALKNALLVLHAPSSMLDIYEDKIENQESRVINEEEMEKEHSLKDKLKIK